MRNQWRCQLLLMQPVKQYYMKEEEEQTGWNIEMLLRPRCAAVCGVRRCPPPSPLTFAVLYTRTVGHDPFQSNASVPLFEALWQRFPVLRDPFL